jgi:uncharacterized membrane protein
MTGILPHWLERLLGVDSSASGEGTVWRLDHNWPCAPWITVLFVLAVVALVVTVYRSEAGKAGRILRTLLALLRLTAIAIVLLMLAQWVLKLNPTQLPWLVVVVDDSESMKIADPIENEKQKAELTKRIEQLGLEGITRLNQAKILLLEKDAALLRGIDKRYKLKVYFCSELARPQSGTLDDIRRTIHDLQPTGKATRLGDGLRAILNDQNLTGIAAIILLTDGVTTDGERLVGQAIPTRSVSEDKSRSVSEVANADAFITDGGAADFARSKGVPLFTVGLGAESPLKDIELTDLRAPDVAFVDDVLTFTFNLSATAYSGRDVEVRLRDKISGAVLAKQSVKLGADGRRQELTLATRPDKIGDFEYIVEVDQLPDEVRHDNNQLERQVSIRKTQIKVLLVQAYPNYEFRYLKNMLQRDTTIDLHTVLQEADVEYAAQDKTALAMFPVHRDDLMAYDVVIFGDVNPALLNAEALNNLSDFVVQRGGGLAMIAGAQFDPLAYRNTPLANLLPIELSSAVAPNPRQPIHDGFVMQPTADGLNYPNMQLGDMPAETMQIWRNLSPLYWYLEAPAKESADVLAEHPTAQTADGRHAPLIVARRAGAGMVLFHATDETWRWRRQVGDSYFARYWVQAIRYLSRTKLLGKDQAARLTTNRKHYSRGEPVRLRLEFTDERLSPSGEGGATVALRRGDQAERRLALRRNPLHREVFEGTVDDLTEGSYRAALVEPAIPGEPSVDFLVKVSAAEFERTQIDVPELEGAAAKTKGRFYRFGAAGTLLDDLPIGRHVPMKPTSPPLELWNQWPVLALLLTVLVAEWTLRKRRGML